MNIEQEEEYRTRNKEGRVSNKNIEQGTRKDELKIFEMNIEQGGRILNVGHFYSSFFLPCSLFNILFPFLVRYFS